MQSTVKRAGSLKLSGLEDMCIRDSAAIKVQMKNIGLDHAFHVNSHELKSQLQKSLSSTFFRTSEDQFARLEEQEPTRSGISFGKTSRLLCTAKKF